MQNNSTTREDVVYYRTPCFLIYDSPEVKEYPTHWHNAVEILMPTENVFPVICGDTEFTLRENDILIIPPGELHCLKAQQGRRIIMICDNTMLEGNPALSEINSLLSEPLWIESDDDKAFSSELNAIIIDMMRIFEKSPPFCETLLFRKFIGLLIKIAEYRISTENKDEIHSDIMTGIRNYTDSFFMNPITLDNLSDALGYSKYHISRTLSDNGTSFSNIVNARRIKAAETMLGEVSSSITQIAFNSGFTSITTFNRAFRKAKGCTPTEFREMYREKNIF